MIEQGAYEEQSEPVYPPENNSSGNNTYDNVEVDASFFYFLVCSLLFISFGGACYRATQNCCQDIKNYSQRSSLQAYLTSRELEGSERSEESSDPCSICLENFVPNGLTIKLHCNHTFHSQCITEWLQNDLTCPNCRTPLDI